MPSKKILKNKEKMEKNKMNKTYKDFIVARSTL